LFFFSPRFLWHFRPKQIGCERRHVDPLGPTLAEPTWWR
jgi:predicted Abi (CAAX) family protease